MFIEYSTGFRKRFKERVSRSKSLREKFGKAVKLFLEDRDNSALSDHPLHGSMQGLRAFEVGEDCRVVYLETKNSYKFLDVGTHKQVCRD